MSSHDMPQEVTTLHIDPRSRYQSSVISRVLGSRTFITAVILSLIAAAVFGAIHLLESAAFAWALPAAAICASFSAFLGWLFMYAVTYQPRLSPPATVQDVMKGKRKYNLADAASYPAVQLLGKHYRQGSPEELQRFFSDICGHGPVQSFLRRLELDVVSVQEVVGRYVIPDFSWRSMSHLLGQYLPQVSRPYVEIIDLFAVFLLHPRLRNFLRQHNLQETDILFMAWWQHARQRVMGEGRRWWSASNLLGFPGIGLSWAAGYTPFIDQFSRPPKGSLWDSAVAHAEEVELLVNSLARRRQSNVLLVGQPGVGRIGVVKELMARVAAGTAHPALQHQRVVYVHISELISFGKNPSEQLAFVARALKEMEQSGNIIAVLDGLGSIVGGGDGRLDLGDILVPFFSSPGVRVVVVMSTDDYHLRIAGNQELEHLFEIVEVPPLSGDATLQLLALTIEDWERESSIFLPYKTLQEIVESTSSILPHIPFPEKAFDILEELVVEAQGRKQEVIRPIDVHALIARKTGVNFGRVQQAESQRLLSLGDFIHRRVVNQESGVEAVVRAMVRARAGVRSRKRPIGSFLFLGPTGVGKTETGKALAEAFFGSDTYLQRLDMSEFQGEDAINRMIGTIERPVGRLPGIISNHPFCVLLLDEFEKASKNVQELFLPLLDEGYLADAHGRRYSFVHTIIIATSNAGAEMIRQEVKDDGKLPENFDIQLREHILSQGIFLPELLNRFDGVITFAPLTPAHIEKIAQFMLAELNTRLDSKHGITVRITPDLISYLAASGYDPQFGARPMRRLIQDKVEYFAAQQIIAGRVEPGQEITIPVRQALMTN